jgi:hypothetical protein
MQGLERHLHETDRRVALGEEQILRQRAIIVDLEAGGNDADLAKDLLALPGSAKSHPVSTKICRLLRHQPSFSRRALGGGW